MTELRIQVLRLPEAPADVRFVGFAGGKGVRRLGNKKPIRLNRSDSRVSKSPTAREFRSHDLVILGIVEDDGEIAISSDTRVVIARANGGKEKPQVCFFLDVFEDPAGVMRALTRKELEKALSKENEKVHTV